MAINSGCELRVWIEGTIREYHLTARFGARPWYQNAANTIDVYDVCHSTLWFGAGPWHENTVKLDGFCHLCHSALWFGAWPRHSSAVRT